MGPSHVDGKKRLYARVSTADPATLAIANYYSEKQRKYRKRQVHRALKVLTPLMLRFVCLYRKYKFFNAIYLIQALIRGFYVRNHIPELVEALIARRIRRLLAVIRIRRYLRQHADQIYRRYLRAKMDQQRRRRATISIPVKMSVSASEKVHSSRPQQPRVPRKVYSISDDILPSGINIPGLSGQPVSAATGFPPTVPGGGRGGTAAADNLLNDAVNPGVADADGVGFNGGPAPHTGSSDDSLTGGSEFTAGDENISGKNAAAKPPQRFSTGAYTERVKEYLQFGKILPRNASSSVQPNKYAAHYMQKRNSKPGVPGSGGPSAAAPVPGAPLPPGAPPAQDQPQQSATSLSDERQAAEEALPAASTTAAHDPSANESQPAPGRDRAASAASLLWCAVDEQPSEGEVASDEPLSPGKLRPNLYISTRFSSDGSDTNSSSHALRSEATHSTPFSGAGTVRRDSLTESVPDEVVPELPAPEVLSPTSGIRIVDSNYVDSDDENATPAGRAKANSLAFSENGSDVDATSPLSLLDIKVVGDSSKSAQGSHDEVVHGSSRGKYLCTYYAVSGSLITTLAFATASGRSHAARTSLAGDDDDRASVLSSNSNSTTPARRSSAAGSNTDFETSQPVLLAILGHNNARSNSTSTLGVASDSTDRPHRAVIDSDYGANVADDGTVVSTVSQSSTRTGRSTLRSSLPPNFMHDPKKISPIGRYAAEKSYDMARIFTPRVGGVAGASRVPFQSASVDGDPEKGAVLSPLQQHRLPPPPGTRTTRLGLLSDTGKPGRRQSFMGGSTYSISRKFNSHDLDSISESMSMSTSEKLGTGKGVLASNYRTRSERLSGWESADQGSAYETADEPPAEEQHYNWRGNEPRRRATLHASLPRSPLGGGDHPPTRLATVSEHSEHGRTKETGAGAANEWVPRSEHLQYYLHSKSGSPKAQGGRTNVDSPSRSSTHTRPFADHDKDGKGSPKHSNAAAEADSQAAESSHSAQAGRTRGRTLTDAGDGEEGEEEDDELEFAAVDDLLEAVKKPPLRTLGCNVMDYMNRQQVSQEVLVCMSMALGARSLLCSQYLL
jgi:hypothetical protein